MHKANSFVTSIFLVLVYNVCYVLCSNSDIALNRLPRKTLKVYWNIPTFQCDSYKLNFSLLAEKYNIIQNERDRFRGSKLAILYDPGAFPAILKNGTDIILRNGGVPQEGNLTSHLDLFQEILQELIPNQNFSGIGIIDFESWRPIFRQNFGALAPYKEISIKIEKKKNPFWPDAWVEKEATKRFEFSAKRFMEETLLLAQLLRPNASWGYYAYPYCFNMSPSNMKQECPKNVQEENNRIEWLYSVSDVLYPSIYLGNTRLNAKEKIQMVKGRIEEALRLETVIKKKRTILPYFWYKYHDTDEFLTKEDLRNVFITLSTYNIDGVVLWGSSNDVNSRTKCTKLYKYIQDVLGPIRNSV